VYVSTRDDTANAGIDAGDEFGWSVSTSGNDIIIGAIGDDDNGFASGAAYIFYRDTGAMPWMQLLLPDE